MSRELYGSFQNRMMENNQFCPEITVGTGVTEFHYTDRDAYEVIAVKDQKHVTIRKYDHKLAGEPMSNDWKLISNENNPSIELVKRGKYWYSKVTATIEDVESEDEHRRFWVALVGFDVDKIKEKGKQTKYFKKNVSFGIADYYYDYSF